MLRSFLHLAVCGALSWLSPFAIQAQLSSTPDAVSNSSTLPEKLQFASTQPEVRRKTLQLDGGPNPYRTWLDEDVVWIITDQERAAFKLLSNDEQRNDFIQAFWERREATSYNRERHYRRIAYAIERFGAGIPGWKTDRGRIYIMFGPPDEIESHPLGETQDPPQGTTDIAPAKYASQVWRYHEVKGVDDFAFEFVDTCGCGDYRISPDASGKDVIELAKKLLYEPFSLPTGPSTSARSTGSAPVRFKELEAATRQKAALLNPFPFEVRTDFVRVTPSMTLVPITLQFENPDITFKTENGVDRGAVNILGKVTSLTGRSVETFEDELQVDVPHELIGKITKNQSLYSHRSWLPPGRYKLNIAAHDANGERIGVWSRSVAVPQFPDDRLAASSLLIAKWAQPSNQKFCMGISSASSMRLIIGQVPSCSSVIGGVSVLPTVPSADGKPGVYRKDQEIYVWMQVYNLHFEKNTPGSSASIEYTVVSTGTKSALIHMTDSTNAMGDQITLQKKIQTSTLQPGIYQLQIKVHDNYSGQMISKEAAFSIE